MQQFILGIGAPKAGTSWIHNRLSLSENVDCGFLKEYHVFDSIESPQGYWAKKRLKNYRSRLKATQDFSIASNSHGPNNTAFKLASFIDNTSNYFDYMHYLYLRDTKISTCCDITPAYALLSEKTLYIIKDGLESRGFSVRVVFLMRDPVDRLISGMKMKIKNSKLNASYFYDEFRKLIAAPHRSTQVANGRYQVTIEKIERVFEKQSIYYGFFDSLFNKKSINSLQDFLGLEIPSDNISDVVNPGKKITFATDDKRILELRRSLKDIYNDTYSYCLKKFRSEEVGAWSGYH